MERRGHDAALVTVTPVDTVQYCSPRLPSSEPSFKACVCADMEKKDEGTMNPERDQLEPLSASTGFETSGQQCHPNWETRRTTATGCLTGGVGSNVGGDTSSPTECVGTRADNEITTAPAASNTVFLQPRRKPNDKKTLSEQNKRFDPGGKREEPPPWKAAIMAVFSFWGGNAKVYDTKTVVIAWYEYWLKIGGAKIKCHSVVIFQK